MANQRLQASLRRTGVTASELAKLTGVDIKTAYRWVSPGRAPQPRFRGLIARRLGEDSEWLWPETAQPGADPNGDSTAEIISAFPYRSDAPTSLWWSLVVRANRQIDLLGYTLYFLSLQHPELVATLAAKCEQGVKVRAMVSDPTSEHMLYRDREEGTPLTLGIRVQTTLAAWKPLLDVDGFSLRFQDIPLYNSVFRFDDEMLMTPHLYATPGSQAPMLHLRRLGPGGIFSRFASHFEDVWNNSQTHPSHVDLTQPRSKIAEPSDG